MDKYGKNDEKGEFLPEEGQYLEGIRRMGPQLVAHLLMIFLIIAGNVIFFLDRKRKVGA